MRLLLKLFQNSLDIYTDGSYKSGRGSWAFVIAKRNKILTERFGIARKTTSNRMEFQAVIEALREVPAHQAITLNTDSRVLLEAIEKLSEWRSLGWTKKNNAPIPSVDQMKELASLIQNRKIKWRWVKAHSGIIFNERCDELCIQARNLAKS